MTERPPDPDGIPAGGEDPVEPATGNDPDPAYPDKEGGRG